MRFLVCIAVLACVASLWTSAHAAEAADNSSGCIGFIGDSLTYGSGARVPSGQGPGDPGATDAVGWVRNSLQMSGLASGRKFTVDNRAVAGATTGDFAAAKSGYYPNAFMAFGRCHCLAVMVTLGTNDSRDNFAVTADQYKVHLQSLIANLEHDLPGAKIILNMPIWYDGAKAAGTIASGYSLASAARFETYAPVLKTLADDKTVFVGDTDSYARFKAAAHATGPAALLGPDGLHPNDMGYRMLGHYWFEALRRVLHLEAPPSPHSASP